MGAAIFAQSFSDCYVDLVLPALSWWERIKGFCYNHEQEGALEKKKQKIYI